MINLLFLEQFSRVSGGQIVLLQIIDSLDKNKFKIIVVLPQEEELSDELKQRGIAYQILPIGSYAAGKKTLWDMVKYLFATIRLVPITVALIKKEKISLIYANAPRTYLWGTAAARLTGKPVIWHVHSILMGIELWLCRSVAQILGVSKIIAISKAVAQPFLPAFGNKLEIVYNGVDCERFALAWKEPGSNKVVGYIGQLAKWKGIEDYLRAAGQVANENVVFWVVGSVLFGDQKYEERLKSIVNDLKINQRVKFWGQRQDIPQLLSMMDILVVPSAEPEPLSLAMLEGMAAGKAVIAAAHGGPVEVIEDGINGRLYPPKNVSKLTAIVMELLDNMNERDRLGQNAREKVRTQLSLPIFTQKINQIICQVIEAN